MPEHHACGGCGRVFEGDPEENGFEPIPNGGWHDTECGSDRAAIGWPPEVADHDVTETDEKTYDIDLEEVSTEQVGYLLAAMSQLQMMAMMNHRLDDANLGGELMGKLMRQNPDAVREVLLDSRDHVHIEHLPEDILDMLDVGVDPDGSVYDARENVEVEVE